jgi:DNA helicase-2/ATP-dependent DNA helicase PcrA
VPRRQTFEGTHGASATLRDFLEHASGLHAQELGAGEDRRVTVSTIHRAKGTESTLVILLGWRGAAAPLLAIACLPGSGGAL